MPGGIHPPLAVLEEWAKIGNPLHPTETRGWGLAILCIVLYTLATVVVLARLWARFKVRQTSGLDDALIVLAMVRRFYDLKRSSNSRMPRSPPPVWQYPQLSPREVTASTATCTISLPNSQYRVDKLHWLWKLLTLLRPR
jgi:hypothetical protein